MQTEKGRVGDLDQGVIHLEVKQGADAPRAHLIQATRSPAWPGSGQGGQGAAVTVRAQGDMAFLGQQHLARFAVHGGHLPLDEEADVVQAEAVVLVEEPGGFVVVLGAGHDVERQRGAVSPAERDDLLGVELEQARGRDGADRVRPLRAVKPEPRPRAPRHEHHPDLARRQHRGPQFGRVPPLDPFGVGPRQAVHVDRPDVVGLGDVRNVLPHQLGDQPVKLVEVNALNLGDKPGPGLVGQVVPPAQEVLLTVSGQACNERRVGGHSQPLLSDQGR